MGDPSLGHKVQAAPRASPSPVVLWDGINHPHKQISPFPNTHSTDFRWKTSSWFFFSPPKSLRNFQHFCIFSFPSREKLITSPSHWGAEPGGGCCQIRRCCDGKELGVHPHTALPRRAGTAQMSLLVRGSEKAGRLRSLVL